MKKISLQKIPHKAPALRVNSLIITLFGDAIAPHGGAILLKGLVDLMASFGIPATSVRTGAFRLMREGWLTTQKVGKHSEYRLTPAGATRVERACNRIYQPPPPQTDGVWQFVIIPRDQLTPAVRQTLRSDLLWNGYGEIANDVFVHPVIDHGRLREILKQNGCERLIAAYSAKMTEGFPAAPTATLVRQCWTLDHLAADYRRFIEEFRPCSEAPDSGACDPEDAFRLRTLLIHEFRRILLRDPGLPPDLLPRGWPGHEARKLCETIYWQRLQASERHLESVAGNAPNWRAAKHNALAARFGNERRSDQVE